MTYKNAIQVAREKAMLYQRYYAVYACKGHWWNFERFNYCPVENLLDRKLITFIQPDGRTH
jgi:hypothetical protein